MSYIKPKKLSLMAAVAIIIINVAAAYGQSTNGWQTFNDPWRGFTFQMPREWEALRLDNQNRYDFRFSRKEAGGMLLTVLRTNFRNDNVSEHVNYAKSQYPNEHIVDREQPFQGKLRGSYLDISLSIPNRVFARHVRFYFLRIDAKTVYVLRFDGAFEPWENIWIFDVENIVKSFDVLDHRR